MFQSSSIALILWGKYFQVKLNLNPIFNDRLYCEEADDQTDGDGTTIRATQAERLVLSYDPNQPASESLSRKQLERISDK